MHTQQIKSMCLSGLLILSLCACQNTISGFGQDVENTGKSIAEFPKKNNREPIMEGHTHTLPSLIQSCYCTAQCMPCAHTHTAGSDKLRNTLTDAGGVCHHQPLIDIEPKKISRMKHKACYDADIWIFLSQHSIAHNIRLLKSCLDCQTIIAVGPGTCEKIEAQGLTVDAIPECDYSTQGLLNMHQLQETKRKKYSYSLKLPRRKH